MAKLFTLITGVLLILFTLPLLASNCDKSEVIFNNDLDIDLIVKSVQKFKNTHYKGLSAGDVIPAHSSATLYADSGSGSRGSAGGIVNLVDSNNNQFKFKYDFSTHSIFGIGACHVFDAYGHAANEGLFSINKFAWSGRPAKLQFVIYPAPFIIHPF